jgi:hypothetical protein
LKGACFPTANACKWQQLQSVNAIVDILLNMNVDRRKAALFGAAAAVRLLLFTSFPGLPDLLTGRVEISTPMTSFKRCMFSADWDFTRIS